MKRERRRGNAASERKRRAQVAVPEGIRSVGCAVQLGRDERIQGIGKTVGTGYCRLCHGKFSSRSLRHAFGKVPVTGLSSEKQKRLDHVFFADFHQLVGVSVRQDPELPQFVCKHCHAQFYKCRSVLRTFIQKVNTSPTNPHGNKSDKIHDVIGSTTGPCADLITSTPECLHSLVNWTHKHAGGCSFLPILQRVMATQYCGIIQAVWECGGGHDYIMQPDSDCISSPAQPEEEMSPEQGLSGNGIHRINTRTIPDSEYNPPDRINTASVLLDTCVVVNHITQNRTPSPPLAAPDSSQGQDCRNSTLASNDHSKEDCSDLSDGDFQSQEEGEPGQQPSSDDSFEPCIAKRNPQKKREPRKSQKLTEFREKKKPGPKPGWKKIKREREELPTIYKCPYQGCTAVYRGADGMKKHIKEHHEEVRERPCPHPGCNKVFMIDRYLQRHVKLIHTEERNHICDQCGQAFKQRKHLSVHQMRHSGAKPLQCEVCGFQCRQRASLKYHMTKHKAEADLEFACDQCAKRFEKAHNLNVHMSMVHPLTQSPAKQPETEPDAHSGTTEEQVLKPELTQQLPP
ncbi:hypothetical protein XENTR_v10011527 [Xenopus tropicalis]|uniref:Zinc finger protein 276 n=1 Tax=Xenopus tropicalis TaxID=8364 RepID=F6PTB7_XENTR|nr:zinc finger protein 276 [Xenopus tropicalis]KAE8608532.1 hypothetical protein XENTR_v10011527 [Xenopus tropicalis]|eukprot:XP_002933710.1 PREDICTED: zinc finger protein 276 [Xenopus tropicalis]